MSLMVITGTIRRSAITRKFSSRLSAPAAAPKNAFKGAMLSSLVGSAPARRSTAPKKRMASTTAKLNTAKAGHR